MSRQTLKRVRDEINAALETTTTAEQTATDPSLSFIPADTFKQIARPLRRALRLIAEPKPKSPSRAEQDAALLFDVMHTGDSDVSYEIGCVLDEYLEPSQAVYDMREVFMLVYRAVSSESQDERVTAILRQLKQGVQPSDIARQLKEGTLR